MGMALSFEGGNGTWVDEHQRTAADLLQASITEVYQSIELLGIAK